MRLSLSDVNELRLQSNVEKTILVVKPEQLNESKLVFEETGVVITAEGANYLGTPFGSKKFLTNRADKIGKKLEKLSRVASIYPKAAYTGFTFGFRNKWNFLARTVDTFSDHVHCLEETIENQFIPALLGHPCNPNLRDISRLPCRLGGLDIQNPVMYSPGELTSNELCYSGYHFDDPHKRTAIIVNGGHAMSRRNRGMFL